MSGMILATKLYAPTSQPGAVLRPRLIERLNQGLQRKLVLIAAPAGFGKTTVVSDWLAGCGRPVAWLSLDEGDSDPQRFLAYLVAALQSVEPQIGQEVLSVLASAQPPPAESMLTALLNEIVTLPNDVMLVLDDYHVVDSSEADDILTFLLDHLPRQLHLVITTREDPRLPLARLRVRGQMTELRANDLRFTATESAEFLDRVMGLQLSEHDIAALEARTEGWIAGLQLAALSLQDHHDPAGFIQAFAGDHRYIADYLVDEVLQRQPVEICTFLLQTSLLDRLTGSLCDAVTGQEGGDGRLEALARGNFFVIPLDDQRRWYRYHHLFADVLHAYLQSEHPAQVTTLHQRASEWFEHQQLMDEAIRHALAAADYSRAADLVERSLPVVRRDRLGVTMLGWIRALPDDIVRVRPVLSVAYATALMSSGETDGVEERLRDAERLLDGEPAQMVVAVDEELRRVPGLIAVYRTGHAYLTGNITATMTYAQAALDLVPDDDHVARGAAEALLAHAYWTLGDLQAAQHHYAAGMTSLQRAGMISDVINGGNTTAAILLAQGRLRDAEHTLEQAIQRATEQGQPGLHGAADFLVTLSEIRRERNDLDGATDLLRRAQEMALGPGVSSNRVRWCLAMAGVKQAQGDLDDALVVLDGAEHLRVPDFFPRMRPVEAVRTRLWLKQGRLDDAIGWAREQRLSPTDDLDYLHEFEHITLARVLLARASSGGQHDEAGALLERLLREAEQGGRLGRVIEILLLQALALHGAGNTAAALGKLEPALTLAEPERYLRTFVDEGAPMAALLETAAKRGIAPGYVRQLMAAFDTTIAEPPARQDLIEPLSDRELDVLHLLVSDLDGPDIARELNVSLNTLRTHTKNIYSKLGVSNRRAAVRQASDLGLLSRTHRSEHLSSS